MRYWKMKIFRFDVTLNLPGRDNIWACFLIFFSAISLIRGITSTHWMVSYRKGDVIIPHQVDLKKIGPFAMSTIRTRNDTLLRFANQDGSNYEVSIYGLSISPDAARELVNQYGSRPVAYLLIDYKNPLRQIWGIQVDAIELLSYQKSVSNYRIDSSGQYTWFIYFAVCVLWFLVSIVDLRRIRK